MTIDGGENNGTEIAPPDHVRHVHVKRVPEVYLLASKHFMEPVKGGQDYLLNFIAGKSRDRFGQVGGVSSGRWSQLQLDSK